MNDIIATALLFTVIGFIAGFAVCASEVDKVFDGEFSRASYEWKLNKEKQNDTTKN